MSKYEDLDDKQLEKEAQRLQNEIAKISAEQDKLAAVRDRRYAEAQAERILEGMSEADLDVLVKMATAGVGASGNSPGGDG